MFIDAQDPNVHGQPLQNLTCRPGETVQWVRVLAGQREDLHLDYWHPLKGQAWLPTPVTRWLGCQT